MNDPFDDKVYDPLYQYQFLFGNQIMVVPVTTAEKQKRLYLTKGEWFNLYTDERMQGSKELQLDAPAYQLPLFIKGSSIIPVQSLVQSTKESPSDTLVLHIYNGTETNNFTYYEDGGDGWNYQKGDYCKRLMHLNPLQNQLQISKQAGSFQSKYRKVQLVLHGFETRQSVTVNQRVFSLSITKERRLFNPLENLKSVYEETYYKSLLNSGSIKEQQAAVIDFDSNEMLIEWK
jgi:alpha-glucosidase